MLGLFQDLFFNTETLIATLIGFVGIAGMILFVSLYKIKNPITNPVELSQKDATELEWNLNAGERKIINKKIIIKLFIIIVPILFLYLFSKRLELGIDSNNLAIGYLLFIAVVFGLSYLFMVIIAPKNLHYKLTNQGIVVNRGNSEGFFTWDNFIYFSGKFQGISLDNIDSEIQDRSVMKQLRDIRGEIFYLKFNSRGFFSKINFIERILVIYTRPDNYQKVHAFLTDKLPQEPIKNLGFQSYYFK